MLFFFKQKEPIPVNNTHTYVLMYVPRGLEKVSLLCVGKGNESLLTPPSPTSASFDVLPLACVIFVTKQNRV